MNPINWHHAQKVEGKWNQEAILSAGKMLVPSAIWPPRSVQGFSWVGKFPKEVVCCEGEASSIVALRKRKLVVRREGVGSFSREIGEEIFPPCLAWPAQLPVQKRGR